MGPSCAGIRHPSAQSSNAVLFWGQLFYLHTSCTQAQLPVLLLLLLLCPICVQADKQGCCLVVTTGGTGPAPRDVTPEATEAVCDRMMPGYGEQMRAISLKYVPTAVLSRQTAGAGVQLCSSSSCSQAAVAAQSSVERLLLWFCAVQCSNPL